MKGFHGLMARTGAVLWHTLPRHAKMQVFDPPRPISQSFHQCISVVSQTSL